MLDMRWRRSRRARRLSAAVGAVLIGASGASALLASGAVGLSGASAAQTYECFPVNASGGQLGEACVTFSQANPTGPITATFTITSIPPGAYIDDVEVCVSRTQVTITEARTSCPGQFFYESFAAHTSSPTFTLTLPASDAGFFIDISVSCPAQCTHSGTGTGGGQVPPPTTTTTTTPGATTTTTPGATTTTPPGATTTTPGATTTTSPRIVVAVPTTATPSTVAVPTTATPSTVAVPTTATPSTVAVSPTTAPLTVTVTAPTSSTTSSLAFTGFDTLRASVLALVLLLLGSGLLLLSRRPRKS